MREQPLLLEQRKLVANGRGAAIQRGSAAIAFDATGWPVRR